MLTCEAECALGGRPEHCTMYHRQSEWESKTVYSTMKKIPAQNTNSTKVNYSQCVYCQIYNQKNETTLY